MKKFFLMAIILFLGSLNGCSVNGHDIVHVDSPIQSTLKPEKPICGMNFLFYEGYDSTNKVEFWYSVLMTNEEYRDANIIISYKSGDQGPALKAFMAKDEETHAFDIYIENDTKIVIEVDRPDDNGTMQYCDAQEFELKL